MLFIGPLAALLTPPPPLDIIPLPLAWEEFEDCCCPWGIMVGPPNPARRESSGP
jgi:hypothetical protein